MAFQQFIQRFPVVRLELDVAPEHRPPHRQQVHLFDELEVVVPHHRMLRDGKVEQRSVVRSSCACDHVLRSEELPVEQVYRRRGVDVNQTVLKYPVNAQIRSRICVERRLDCLYAVPDVAVPHFVTQRHVLYRPFVGGQNPFGDWVVIVFLTTRGSSLVVSRCFRRHSFEHAYILYPVYPGVAARLPQRLEECDVVYPWFAEVRVSVYVFVESFIVQCR
ncbi:hypothetical protein BOVATA_035820 [Babesia ovata]|uniref:Uncharacterized protein n=1 Tax=Babesia ovata TaxID=189622 RepID=A0A2H6KGJ5_9APIC|nr:uncharacterized protein BOVATA_035820 [Babesia ovata]GBE62089.1 hypothetical protein BOVATA_035820 [Babesia ovata]